MQPSPEAKASILLAEDEPGLRKLVSTILREQGYTVLAAGDGHSALNLARKHEGNIDLLITDVIMPKLDGFDLREKILQERSNLKILVMSGALDPEISGEEFSIIRKPFERAEFIRKVKELLPDPVV